MTDVGMGFALGNRLAPKVRGFTMLLSGAYMSVFQKIFPAVITCLGVASGAHAQSSATLYGSLDLAFGSFQSSALAAASKHVTKVDGNVMVTSYLGFKGVEDIGGGLKAGYTLETFLRPDTGAAGRSDADVFWGRNANVWLQNSLGKVTLGRQATLGFSHVVAFNPFAGGFGISPAVRLTYGAWGNDKGDSAWSNAVSYASPAMSGLTVSVQAQTGEVADHAERTSYGASATYTSGALSLGLVAHTLRSAEAPKPALTAGQKQNFVMASGSYDAGFAKVFAQYGQYDNAGYTAASKIDTSLFQIGASVPVTTAGKVLASVGQSLEKPVAGGSTLRTKHTITSVAYDHFLSKRTDVYAAFINDQESLAGYESGQTYLVGVRHAF